jgi:hypothetical protein
VIDAVYRAESRRADPLCGDSNSQRRRGTKPSPRRSSAARGHAGESARLARRHRLLQGHRRHVPSCPFDASSVEIAERLEADAMLQDSFSGSCVRYPLAVNGYLSGI